MFAVAEEGAEYGETGGELRGVQAVGVVGQVVGGGVVAIVVGGGVAGRGEGGGRRGVVFVGGG